MPIIKEYITLNIEDIIPYANNPRINDDAVAGVVESIKQCGELDPKYVSVIVNRLLNLTGRKDEIFCIRDGQKLTYDEVFN